MDANEYQRQAMRSANLDLSPKSTLVNAALGLAGEAGEFGDHIKKVIFHDHVLDPTHLDEELGDLLWYVAQACTGLGIEMGAVMQRNIDKLKLRYPGKFNSADSMARRDVRPHAKLD